MFKKKVEFSIIGVCSLKKGVVEREKKDERARGEDRLTAASTTTSGTTTRSYRGIGSRSERQDTYKITLTTETRKLRFDSFYSNK